MARLSKKQKKKLGKVSALANTKAEEGNPPSLPLVSGKAVTSPEDDKIYSEIEPHHNATLTNFEDENGATSSPWFVCRKFLLVIYPILAFFLYKPAYHAPFIFDDQRNLFDNQVRLTELTVKGLSEAAFHGALSTRPVANLTFALNYYFHGEEPFGYRMVNIFIHLLVTCLLFVFVSQLFQTPALKNRVRAPFAVAFFTGLLWLVHPLNIQSVTYVVQRMNSLAAMFYLLALVLYIRARQSNNNWILFICSFAAFILSLGSKEWAATLPFFIILFEWYFFWDLKRPPWRILVVAGSFVLLLFLGIVFHYLGENPFAVFSATEFVNRDYTLGQRLLTELRVVVFYLSLIVYPHPSRLNFLHDFSLSTSLLAPMTTLFSALLLFGAFIAAIVFARRERLLSFCILWFLGNLVIESSFIPLEIIFEHRTYLPSMSIILLIVSLLFRWSNSISGPALIVLCLAAVTGTWTYGRNTIWSDAVVFWQDCLAKSPRSARAHNNLGYALKNEGRYQEAIEQFYQALRLEPDLAMAGYNLKMTQALGQSPSNAIALYRDAVRINPHNAGAFYNLGVMLAQQGNDEEAVRQYKEALRLRPDQAEAHNNLASALSRLGKTAESLEHLRLALRYQPNDAIAHYNLGYMLARQREYKEALSHLKEALHLQPDFDKAREELRRISPLVRE